MNNVRLIIAMAFMISAANLSAGTMIVSDNTSNNTKMSVISNMDDYLTIKGDVVEVKITDATGKTLYTYHLDESAMSHHIDVSNLGAGEYKCVMSNKNNEEHSSSFKRS